ncbi:hypothetical protein HGA00_03710 [Gordonia sputi]|nr:hypothetical protein [Gordonia sputi]
MTPAATTGPASSWPEGLSAAAVVLVPIASMGSTGPMFTARNGSSPVASSHRPIHPLVTAEPGDAVCQMSIDRKWL